MRITFFGSAEFGIPCLEAILSQKTAHQLVAVFTQPARPAGRKKKLTPTPVALWAEKNSIKPVEAEDINSADMLDKIAASGGDLLLVIAFGQKIGKDAIAMFNKGAINVHASLLPKYRGAAPINWPIINGDTKTGITIITIAEKMDAGQILGRKTVDIDDDDTAQTLHDKLACAAPELLIDTLGRIADGSAEYIDQDESAVTLAPKLKKSDGNIDWSCSAAIIKNRIQGMWPWPGAQTIFASTKTAKTCRVTIARAMVVGTSEKHGLEAGSLDKNLNVVCGAGLLKIIQLKPAGGGLMEFESFVNGREVRPGDKFLQVDQGN